MSKLNLKGLALIFCLMTLIFGVLAQAKAVPKKNSKLSTNVDFNDRLVGGKYQYSTEAITTVENDKNLDDLIGVRKNFKDRIEQTKALR